MTDSFHSLWALVDTSLGLKKETLATIAIAVARGQKAPAEVLASWNILADSYAGLYRVAATEGVTTMTPSDSSASTTPCMVKTRASRSS